jgi:hypothetical protein
MGHSRCLRRARPSQEGTATAPYRPNMIGLRYQHHYDGPADDDRINVVIRVFGRNGAPPISINALLDTGAERSVFDS